MPQAALRQLLALGILQGEAQITGADPVLRTPYRAGTAGLTMETSSPAGRITHLKPVVQLSETPARWARPPVPPGHHRPEWP